MKKNKLAFKLIDRQTQKQKYQREVKMLLYQQKVEKLL